VLFNPRIDLSTRRGAIEPALRGAHALTRNFVHLAFDRGREDVLRGLAAAFHRRTLSERNQVEGVVESARPLDAADVARIAAGVGRALGKELLLTNRIAPELVGGVRVVAGNRMLDGSLQGRLDALQRRLLAAQLAAEPAR
jgi:F-type H+-transporting ATPase subunit delta